MKRGRAAVGLAALAALSAGPTALHAQVPYERIRDAARDSGSWLTYSGDYAARRHSLLSEITPANVGQLRPIWIYQLQNTQTSAETTPIVADGIMYVTEPMSAVTALDARTGVPVWRWSKPMPVHLRTLGFGPSNRGVAILDSTVFVGTIDAHLVALDARSGAVRWDVTVADNAAGYAITAAPLAIPGAVIVGISGGEAGIRGFLDAYDARTGKRLWRFWTIPAPGEPGSETWTGTAWRTGGGPTWVTGSYDPDLDLLYWGVGNPGPDWNGDRRPGDNLYTASLVAVEARTGRLRWYFQFTPHDVHDWDATEIPVLFDAPIDGRQRKLVGMANRNAFYYVLDRSTGKFVHGAPYARETWARGLDSAGRPLADPVQAPSDSGTLTYPSLQGATNWFSPSYDPTTGSFFVAVREMGAIYYKRPAVYKPGQLFDGGGEHTLENDSASGAIRALDATTGAVKWSFHLFSPPWFGVLSTAGGLVFGGSNEGYAFALDATTGKPLWRFQTGGVMEGAPMSFLLGGHQAIAVAAQGAVIVFGLP
jgi:alcohol dehydrogenase (cytochrome c)